MKIKRDKLYFFHLEKQLLTKKFSIELQVDNIGGSEWSIKFNRKGNKGQRKLAVHLETIKGSEEIPHKNDVQLCSYSIKLNNHLDDSKSVSVKCFWREFDLNCEGESHRLIDIAKILDPESGFLNEEGKVAICMQLEVHSTVIVGNRTFNIHDSDYRKTSISSHGVHAFTELFAFHSERMKRGTDGTELDPKVCTWLHYWEAFQLMQGARVINKFDDMNSYNVNHLEKVLAIGEFFGMPTVRRQIEQQILQSTWSQDFNYKAIFNIFTRRHSFPLLTKRMCKQTFHKLSDSREIVSFLKSCPINLWDDESKMIIAKHLVYWMDTNVT